MKPLTVGRREITDERSSFTIVKILMLITALLVDLIRSVTNIISFTTEAST